MGYYKVNRDTRDTKTVLIRLFPTILYKQLFAGQVVEGSVVYSTTGIPRKFVDNDGYAFDFRSNFAPISKDDSAQSASSSSFIGTENAGSSYRTFAAIA
jgi:hypothetical protein